MTQGTPPRTSSGSGLLRSVFAGAGSEVAAAPLAAAPRSGPAWFGDNTKAKKERKGHGMLKSPAELGRTSVDEDSPKKTSKQSSTNKPSAGANVQASETVLEMRQRKQTLCQQQQAAWRQEETLWMDIAAEHGGLPSCVTALTYQGMEIWIGTTDFTAYVCLARTLFLLQILPDWPDNEKIVSVRSHPYTGQIVLVGAAGRLQTYRPVASSVADVSMGRFRWQAGPVVHSKTLLMGASSESIHVSLSAEWKVLAARGQQLAVWDAAGEQAVEAPVLWMTKLPAPVQSASIAGDGQALAVVLSRLSMDDANDADGVHTFERDWDDGAEAAGPTVVPRTVSDSSNVGIVYKPGPFLVHSAPVTRLVFRGCGFCTSSQSDREDAAVSADKTQISNDLLLSTSQDGTARIFGQEGWKSLTEWHCGEQTRVDWIRGQAAFSLGDLEAKHSSAGRKSRGMSRSASKSTLDSLDAPQEVGNEAQQHRMPTIPAHTTPLSQAGAWIAEISWELPNEDDNEEQHNVLSDELPWITLSRLTYLKRGTGDLTPTLLESVSAVLPPVSVMKSAVLTRLDDSLVVEGLWPAWNPFVDVPLDSSSSNADMIETLRGSAMAFLGLAQTDGYFGDALLQGTQCPPTELRLTTAHPVTGHVVVLEFHLHGQDKNLDALELGTPIRSVVSLGALEMNAKASPSTVATTRHGRGSLWAAVPDGTRVQLHWRQPGTLSLMPAQWLPTDILSPPETICSILKGTTRFRDESLLPVPLALRPLPAALAEDPVRLLQWWPERSEILPLHGPRLLLAWKGSGGATVLQVLPPLAERTIPEDGCGSAAFQRSSEAHYLQRQSSSRLRRRNTFSDSEGRGNTEIYEVSILPDPNHGLGLRLESLDDGEPAVAGSFKKNPETGEALPAERTGAIALGDELVSVNGVPLEDKNFDDVINTVREFGANASPGNPVRMRFRRKRYVREGGSIVSSTNASLQRRTMEDMFGLPRGIAQSSGTVSSLGSSQPDIAVPEPVEDPCVACHIKPISGMDQVLMDKGAEKRVLLIADPTLEKIHAQPSASLLIFVSQSGLHITRLRLREGNTDVECTPLGSFDLPSLQTLTMVKTTCDQLHLLGYSPRGMQLLVATLRSSEDRALIRSWLLSNSKLADPEKSIIRCHSLHFLASTEVKNGHCTSINVWTPQLHPGCDFSSDTESDSNSSVCEEYCKTVIELEAGLDLNNDITDFGFISSGFLDSSPLLLTFSKEGVLVYQRKRGSFDWILAFSVLYGHGLNALPLHFRPTDCIPHLTAAVRKCFSSDDENKFLVSDWHPESLLAQACTDQAGIQATLQGQIRQLFLWLAKEGKSMLEDFPKLPLLCSKPSFAEMSSPEDATTSGDLFGIGSSMLPRAYDEKTQILTSFRDEMLRHQDGTVDENPTDLSWVSLMKREDVRILLALVHLVLDPPAFKYMDKCGELFVFASALLSNFSKTTSKPDEDKKTFTFHIPGVLQKQSSSLSSSKALDEKSVSFIASAACVSALLSFSQETLVASAKTMDPKFDWLVARKLRMSFWVRSDVSLAQIAEDVGQTIYREKRSIMECAIFFIISKKRKKLRNLAATDRSDSGTKFFKFITSHDFASERGRRAAEKNAFSLLRKNRYQEASALFLLSEPPALQSALETILTKMQDMELAFMVARLIESNEVQSDSVQGSAGGFAGFGGILGGGGGYAGTGNTESPKPSSTASESFHQWTPSCGRSTRKLLVERLLPWAATDPALGAVFLLWMNKHEVASWWLSGFIESSKSSPSGYRFVSDPSARFLGKRKTSSRRQCGEIEDLALEKSNALIDFNSLPFLLRSMKASARAIAATSLLVSETMTVRGVDNPNLWDLLRLPSEEEEEDNGNAGEAPNGDTTHNNEVTSSIFDDFSPPPRNQKDQAQPPVNKNPQSSIFDDFEPPPRPQSTAGGNPQSSIFDSFDHQPPKPAVKSPASDGMAQSSIFDSFDVPTIVKPPAPAVSGVMESSIFDSFAPPPPKSSIFDAYDTPIPVSTQQKGQVPNSQSITPTIQQPNADTQELKEPMPDLKLDLKRMPIPDEWSLLSDDLMLLCASRRLCRAMATEFAFFHGDPPHPHIDEFFEDYGSLIPPGASDILQLSSDASGIIASIQSSLEGIASASGLSKELIADYTTSYLASYESCHRSLFGAVLNTALARTEAAEAVVRFASESILHGAATFAASLDGCAYRGKTRSTVSTLHLRREAVRTCWQLESCLWLHRGGGLPLSSLAVKEAILAVRMGLTLGSWNRHHETLEAVLRCEPDCLLDDESGRYLWSSLKDPTPLDIEEEQPKKTTSGGWEFLVDCRRAEATEILRESPTGSFIIRPHPSDHGVFTLSFKTNLVPADSSHGTHSGGADEESNEQTTKSSAEDENKGKSKSKGVRKDDVVQHAIIRLSDSGFRCGSFGPFSSLIDLLEAVSSSLPFKLRFDLPPQNRVIREEGSQPSPNAVLFRKLALSRADSLVSNPPIGEGLTARGTSPLDKDVSPRTRQTSGEREQSYGCFLELLVLSRLRRQLCSIASVKYSDTSDSAGAADTAALKSATLNGAALMSLQHSQYNAAYWILQPLLSWCRSMEVRATIELAPALVIPGSDVSRPSTSSSEKSIELTLSSDQTVKYESSDAVLRRLIQRDSGVEFSTLRLVDGGDCSMVVLFGKDEALKWLLSTGTEDTEESATDRLASMERERVIEAVDLFKLPLKRPADTNEGIRYRIVDPWEVEAVNDREGETRSVILGRHQYHAFSLGKIALACENDFRDLGGLPLLELWTSSKGGVIMSRALACVHPPWERAAGGDLQVLDGHIKEPEPFDNAIRQHLYRNSLFRRLGLPQRFMALVQVELLDLKNLTSPSGSLSLSVYGLLRLKRKGSSGVLSNKTRTLDTAQTPSVKLGKATGVGPNAPASWGSVVRFRFPLPEGVNIDGSSQDKDRESLFRGPPSVLQISVYEKKLLVDTGLGTADIATDGLWAGGQLEEWVPLRSEKHGGIHWFARIRLTLRFELMCKIDETGDLVPPSVGLERMKSLTENGGAAHEDQKRRMSSSDLMVYLESMVY